MKPIKRIAIIGTGPAGAISVDAFFQEKAFDTIRVFERREKAGGCWVPDSHDANHSLQDLESISNRTADKPLSIPSDLPTYAPHSSQTRYTESTVYDYLESNVDHRTMAFSREPFPNNQSEASIKKYGADTPFKHNKVVREYIESLLNRNGYQDLVEYNTTVERVEKVMCEKENSSEWKVTLRRRGYDNDYWWVEYFDAVVVASGHFWVPWIPHIEGLADFVKKHPDRVEHSKSFRRPEKYQGKRVIVVGASVAGMDIATDLANIAEFPVNSVVRGQWHPYFGEEAFRNPYIKRWPQISRVDSTNSNRIVYFEDGTSLTGVDHIIFCTGYSWTLPFLPDIPIRNNRVPDLYLHIFHRQDPTLVFIGAVAAGLTFKVYEWQSVLAARVLAGRATLPSVQEQEKWEIDRIGLKGDGVPFTLIYPHFEQYFEFVRALAGEPSELKPGRKLPKWDKKWEEHFWNGHRRRIEGWKKGNEIARERLKRIISARGNK